MSYIRVSACQITSLIESVYSSRDCASIATCVCISRDKEINMATIKVFGPYTYYTTNWTPGSYWYPYWGPWPDSGNGTVIVTCHPFTGGYRKIAVTQTISNATGSGGVRY